MDWSTYVQRVIGQDRQAVIAEKTGLDQSTISRWLNPQRKGSPRISSQSVAAFARGYQRPVLEAFVIAGFLTKDEAGMPDTDPVIELGAVSSEELLAELRKRVGG